MLLVVAPNLATDRILQVERFRPAEVQRTCNVRTQPGGKGSNVARVFRQLGGDVTLLGCVGRGDAPRISRPLEAMGVHVEAIEAFDGDTRVCTIIMEKESADHPTVINEESPRVDDQTLATLESRLVRLLDRARFVLVAGSLPQGLPEDFYARVIRQASSRGIETAIDATGAALRHGLAANPTIVKVNANEISTVVGPVDRDIASTISVLRSRRDQLPAHVVVTLGENGAVLMSDGRTWHVVPPHVFHVNPIGSGDAFAAGYIKTWMDSSSCDAALQLATAAAASDASTPEPGIIIPGEIPRLQAATIVQFLPS